MILPNTPSDAVLSLDNLLCPATRHVNFQKQHSGLAITPQFFKFTLSNFKLE